MSDTDKLQDEKAFQEMFMDWLIRRKPKPSGYDVMLLDAMHFAWDAGIKRSLEPRSCAKAHALAGKRLQEGDG